MIKTYSKNSRKHCDYKCTRCKKIFSAPYRTISNKDNPKCNSCAGIKHNASNTRLYNIWSNMIQRCTNKNNNAYIKYGAIGINIYREWKIFENFKNWSEKNGYKNELTIDRINSWENYEPSNCQWITKYKNNRRNSTRENYGKAKYIKISPKHLIEIHKLLDDGKIMHKEIAKIYNVTTGHISSLSSKYKKGKRCQI